MKQKRIYICWEHYVNYAYWISKEDFEKLTNISFGKAYWVTIRNKGKAAWIYLTDYTPETIAHEAFHAVYHTANNVWIKLSLDSEEWFAHSIDKVVKEIVKINQKYWNNPNP